MFKKVRRKVFIKRLKLKIELQNSNYLLALPTGAADVDFGGQFCK